MTETQSSQDISTKLERIAKLAREKPGARLLTLAHHIDVNWLREAYRRTRKDGARGVDVLAVASNRGNLDRDDQAGFERRDGFGLLIAT